MSYRFDVSFFKNRKADTVDNVNVDLDELFEIFKTEPAVPSKEDQKSFNPGRYGPDRSASNCLRTNANYKWSHAAVLDIDDAGGLTFDDITDRLDAVGLMYGAYTTASNGLPGKGLRVRLIFPYAKPHLPAECGVYIARGNGVIGGVAAKESAVPSTGWLYGPITGRPPCRFYISPGEEFIDESDALDATALPLQGATAQVKGGRPDFAGMTDFENRDAIRTGVYGHDPAVVLIGMAIDQKVTEADCVADLEALWDSIPVANRRPKKWTQQRGRIAAWVQQAYARAAKKTGRPFSALVDFAEKENAVRKNEFARRIEVAIPFPPAPGQMQLGNNGQPIEFRGLEDPGDTLEFMIHAQANGFSKAAKSSVFDALYVAGDRHRVHPVREYLNSLKWDGVARLQNLFYEYIPAAVPSVEKGASKEATKRARDYLEYLEQIGPCFMIGAVARIYQPGCKLDNMVVLYSPQQGRNKSKVLAAFMPDPSWFSDDVPANVSDKDAKLAIDGKWFVELAELPHLRKEVDRFKAFLSRATDRYRVPYGRLVQDFPRQCIFIGTTNELEFPDHTGNRRFWPVPVDGLIKDDLITRDRDQLWAEAVFRFRAGEKWWLSAKIEKIARAVQADYVEADVRDESIRDWIEVEFARGAPIKFTVREILERALGYVIDPQDRADDSTRPLATAAEEKRVQRRLRVLGYAPQPQVEIDGKRYRFWGPISAEPDDRA